MRRLKRLRRTAVRAVFLLTTQATRNCLLSFKNKAFPEKKRLESLRPRTNTSWISGGGSRCERASMGLLSEGNLGSPFAPTTSNNPLAGRGFGPYQIPVGFGAFSFFRLICLRHGKQYTHLRFFRQRFQLFISKEFLSSSCKQLITTLGGVR